MAVLKIFEVNILVNGDPVTEYEEHDGNVRDKEVVKYIEVLASTEFALEFKIKPTYRFVEDYLSFDIYMDGKRVRSPVVERKDFEKQKQKQCGYSFVREDVTRQEGQDLVTRKFRFAGITTYEDASHTVNLRPKDLENLGVVSVRVWRHRLIQKTQRHHPGQEEINRTKLPEKVIKGRAVSLSTTLAKAEKTTSRKHTVFEGLDLDTEPVAVFDFKYRTKKSLQELHVIPRTPSPIPLERRPIGELSQDEIRERLLIQERALAEFRDRDRTKVKQEAIEAANVVMKRAKPGDGEDEIEAVSTRPVKRRITDAEEVIELSD